MDPQVNPTHSLLLRGSASSQWEGLAVLTTQRRDQLAQERVVELAAVQILFLPTVAQTGRSCSGFEPTRLALSQHWADFPTKGGRRDLVPSNLTDGDWSRQRTPAAPQVPPDPSAVVAEHCTADGRSLDHRGMGPQRTQIRDFLKEGRKKRGRLSQTGI